MLWLWFLLPFVDAPYVEREQTYKLIPELRKPTRIHKLQRIHAPRHARSMLKMNLFSAVSFI